MAITTFNVNVAGLTRRGEAQRTAHRCCPCRILVAVDGKQHTIIDRLQHGGDDTSFLREGGGRATGSTRLRHLQITARTPPLSPLDFDDNDNHGSAATNPNTQQYSQYYDPLSWARLRSARLASVRETGLPAGCTSKQFSSPPASHVLASFSKRLCDKALALDPT